MKRLTIALSSLLAVCFLNDSIGQNGGSPYVATYTSSFKIGNPAYANIVLNLWKDWDDNQFARHDYFADTVVMWLPDGSVTRGKAANTEGAMKFRSSLTSAKSTIHAWVPLYSTDMQHDMVAIWGTEEDTFADGKKETRELHEVWWFNKDGKVTMVRQWNAKFGELK